MDDYSTSDYNYNSADPAWDNNYLWNPVRRILGSEISPDSRILDVGCGSGTSAGLLADMGFEVVAIDPSETGIAHATTAYPKVRFAQRTAYDDLSSEFGQFDAVLSLEVIEHCAYPRLFAKTIFRALRPGGLAVISTPFHGYWKNLAIALSGKFDEHWSPLWDGGHIKFWSERTLSTLLLEVGFSNPRFLRAGRLPPIAKSMIAVARVPGESHARSATRPDS